jgi:PadR family transcriptional regulator, regulatory protein PadR
MKRTAVIQQSTLAWMVRKPLDVVGPLHAHGIGPRIAQISGCRMALNRETVDPLRLREKQEGAIASGWGPSQTNGRARRYGLTRTGRKQLQAEVQGCQQTADVIARFLTIKVEMQTCSC